MESTRTVKSVPLTRRTSTRLQASLIAALAVVACGGCSALTMPVTGIPAYRVPDSLLAARKDDTQTINLASLRQPKEDVYKLASGDVLGIWIPGVIGDASEVPPTHFSITENLTYPPSVGVPFTVQDDGTIDLPIVAPLNVKGMTLLEVKRAIQKAYTQDQQIIQAGFDRIVVTLAQPRVTHVLVFRQESATTTTGAQNSILPQEINRFKRGTAYALELRAYKNDVLHALSESGGLPGLDAVNEIRIQRGRFADPADREEVARELEAGICSTPGLEETRIPLRLAPGQPLPFRPQDIILNSGDVVFIEARESEVFYTGGLLPPTEIDLPRDHDLDVLEAVAMANGPIFSGGFRLGNATFSAELTRTGQVGSPSPSQLIVLRKTANGRQVPIRVDLNRATWDDHERIIVQANDVLILQQTPDEALASYWVGVVNFTGVFRLFQHEDAVGTATIAAP